VVRKLKAHNYRSVRALNELQRHIDQLNLRRQDLEQNVAGNATRLVGEFFVPGASQYVSGNVASGVVHTLLATAVGAALIGSGVAPVLGSLAVIGVKLNSYSSATTGHGILNFGTGLLRRVGAVRGA
jgi:hypothetical protein